jgi:hypothetical protein
MIAADFFETTTLTGARLHVLAVIEHATRRCPGSSRSIKARPLLLA